jgi:hypothetical protein
VEEIVRYGKTCKSKRGTAGHHVIVVFA